MRRPEGVPTRPDETPVDSFELTDPAPDSGAFHVAHAKKDFYVLLVFGNIRETFADAYKIKKGASTVGREEIKNGIGYTTYFVEDDSAFPTPPEPDSLYTRARHYAHSAYHLGRAPGTFNFVQIHVPRPDLALQATLEQFSLQFLNQLTKYAKSKLIIMCAPEFWGLETLEHILALIILRGINVPTSLLASCMSGAAAYATSTAIAGIATPYLAPVAPAIRWASEHITQIAGTRVRESLPTQFTPANPLSILLLHSHIALTNPVHFEHGDNTLFCRKFMLALKRNGIFAVLNAPLVHLTRVASTGDASVLSYERYGLQAKAPNLALAFTHAEEAEPPSTTFDFMDCWRIDRHRLYKSSPYQAKGPNKNRVMARFYFRDHSEASLSVFCNSHPDQTLDLAYEHDRLILLSHLWEFYVVFSERMTADEPQRTSVHNILRGLLKLITFADEIFSHYQTREALVLCFERVLTPVTGHVFILLNQSTDTRLIRFISELILNIKRKNRIIFSTEHIAKVLTRV